MCKLCCTEVASVSICILAILSSVTLLLCYLYVVVDPEQKNVAFPSQEDVNNSNPKIATKGGYFIGKTIFQFASFLFIRMAFLLMKSIILLTIV